MSFNTKGLMTSNDQTWKTPKKIYDYYMSKNYFDFRMDYMTKSDLNERFGL